jgi:nucleotide-binding universal stress UspA family protein
MEFKDILIHIDETPQCEKRIELAIHLARRHGAHLSGLFAITHLPYAPQYESRKKQAAAAEEKFRQAAEAAAVSSDWILADWGVPTVGMAEIINHYAHTRDLVIVGQSAPERRREAPPANLPERVVFGSGRPVLIVPCAGTFTTVGSRSIVAWRGGRASARALNDSLPLLMNSKKIYALSIKTSGDRFLYESTGSDICSHLKRHGLSCVGEEISAADIPVANILMNFAWEKGCDLLVVGVYAHATGKRLLLGPVGRQLLKDMTLPVLMSH